MTDPNPNSEVAESTEPLSRSQLIWQVLVFQAKLMVDGARDVLLVPVSLLAALFGLLTNRRNPAYLYEIVLVWGRQSDRWINLFNHHRRGQTADDLLEPWQEKLFDEAQKNATLRKASDKVNSSLDRSAESLGNLLDPAKKDHPSTNAPNNPAANKSDS